MTETRPLTDLTAEIDFARTDVEDWTEAEQRLGILEWFRPGEYQRAEALLEDMKALGIRRLRTGVSWADFHTPEGREWFDWLFPTLARDMEVLPCFTYTPPSMGVEYKTSAPPREPRAFADFIDVMITLYGEHFEWLELWNEPNNLNDWDWHLDPDWNVFSRMIGMAAYWARQRGKKTVLAGMCPTDPNWLNLMCARGVVSTVDAVGIHGFPGTWEFSGESWDEKIGKIRSVLGTYDLAPEIWITEVGYSTWRHDEIMQVKRLMEVLNAPAERVYWYSAFDLHPHECHQDGFHEDERHYHFGLKTADGSPKLSYRLWCEGGLSALYKLTETVFHGCAGLSREPAASIRSSRKFDGSDDSSDTRNRTINDKPGEKHRELPGDHELYGEQPVAKKKPVLITGGAGFVGTNIAERLLQQGEPVLIFDNLGRDGVEQNLERLCEKYGRRVQLEIADIRDAHLVSNAVNQASRIFHFAAQVAVTTSVANPQRDFEVNTRGTLNILEAMRGMDNPPPLLFTSTNKVYGALEDLALVKQGERYWPVSRHYEEGIDESQPLDFHSPYGCSKGAADQYVLDYARTYGIPAVVFRMSCIYGPHQFGTEDQGWVAHFLIQALKGKPLTLYGDGRQLRDILYVGDLVDAMLAAHRHIGNLSGRVFNIGGGAANSTSLLEVLARIEKLTGEHCRYSFADWRVGDQKYYVSDTRQFTELTGWEPSTSIDEGLERLYQWVLDNLIAYQPRVFRERRRLTKPCQTQPLKAKPLQTKSSKKSGVIIPC